MSESECKKETITVAIEPALLVELRKLARKSRLSFRAVVERALRLGISRAQSVDRYRAARRARKQNEKAQV